MAQQILCPLPDELFVDREEYLSNLKWIAGQAGRSMKHNLCIFGRWRAGKTLLLLKLYDELFAEQGKVIPIFYTFPEGERQATQFSDDFVRVFAQQYLAFRLNQPSLLQRRLELPELAALAREAGEEWLADRVATHQRLTHPVDLRTRIRSATDLPMNMAATHPWRFVVMLDEFQRAMEHEDPEGRPWDLRGFFQVPMEWWGVNWIITGSALKILEERILTDPLNGRFDACEIGELRVGDAQELARRVATYEGATIPDASVAYLAEHAQKWPFYTFAMARTAAQQVCQDGRKEITLDDVARAAAYEVTQGEVFRQLDLRFKERFVRRPDQDFGRRLLYRFAQAPQAEYHSEELAAELDLPHEQVVELIDVLALSDLIKVNYRLGHRYLISIPDEVLRQFLRMQHERFVAQANLPALTRTELERLRQEISDLQRINGLLMESHLKMLMYTWSRADAARRTVPGAWFGREEEAWVLPKFEHVEDTVFKEPGHPVYQLDAFAPYFDRTDLVGWAVESKFWSEPVGKPQIEKLVAALPAIRTASKVARVVGWYFSARGFTAPARKYAREQGVLLSDLEQVNALLAHFGLKRLELVESEALPTAAMAP